MYRYLGVLIEEFNTMRRAATARNLMSSKRWQRLVVGNMMGSLFLRTYDRGDRVYQAMLARGYTGVPTVGEVPQGTQRDLFALTLTLVVALLGQAIYLLPQ
jgi:cobalt/nickel transport system permease protein